jgi:hypothetical protein
MNEEILALFIHLCKYFTILSKKMLNSLSLSDLSLSLIFGEDSIRCVRILAKAQVLNCNIRAKWCHIDSHLLPKKAVRHSSSYEVGS